jgi:glycosyltransferase involved in cell wall biosynthesis
MVFWQSLRLMSPPEPLKVVIVSPTFGAYGGIEAFVLALARFLKFEPGLKVRLVWKKVKGFVRSEALEQRCVETGVDYVYVEKGSADLWKQLQWADVVHSQNAPPDVILFARLLRKPLALTIHNYLRLNGWRSVAWKGFSRLAQERWYNSNFVWKTWENFGELPGSRRTPTVSELPSGAVPSGERRGFTFISRWIANKGLEVLVDAYAEAGLDPEEWPLNLVGDGPLREPVLKLIAERKVPGVKVHGFVTEAQKADILRRTKWLVVPPHTNEDMGLTPLEARSVGVPVIATRDGGLPEAAGPTALLCEPASVADLKRCLLEAAAMPEAEYAERGQRGLEALQEYLTPLEFYSQAYWRLSKKSHR